MSFVIFLNHEREALDVRDAIEEVFNKNKVLRLSDVNALISFTSVRSDEEQGWTELPEIEITPGSKADRWRLKLPSPTPLP